MPRKAENHAATKGTCGNLVESITDCFTRLRGQSEDKVQSTPSLSFSISCNHLSNYCALLFLLAVINFSIVYFIYNILYDIKISGWLHCQINMRYRFHQSTVLIGYDNSIWHFHHKLDGTRSHPLFTLYKLPRRITYGLPLPTRGLISDIEPEKEGRASPREERNASTLTYWLATPHTLLPFQCMLARNLASGEMRWEEKETAEEEAFVVSFALLYRWQKKSRCLTNPHTVMRMRKFSAKFFYERQYTEERYPWQN